MTEEKKREIEVTKDPNFRTIILSGLFGGIRPGYFEATAYTEETDHSEALKTPVGDGSKVAFRRILQCRLVFDPIEAKRILRWLTDKVSNYESIYGTIVTPEDLYEAKERTKIAKIEKQREKKPEYEGTSIDTPKR